MSHRFRIAYLAHTIRSDWNNGNAHFLRGLLRALQALGHEVTIFEPADEWSIANLRQEKLGEASLLQLSSVYPDLKIITYDGGNSGVSAFWRVALRAHDIVILHEWNRPELAQAMLDVRDALHYKLLFHDTHHRASSSPEAIRSFGTNRFDGVLAFGEALREIYRNRFGMSRVWTLHEAADTTVFKPLLGQAKKEDIIWIGNWGDGERAAEIYEYLLAPATRLPEVRFTIHGVRYPESGLAALRKAGVRYAGYLPNLDAPFAYAASHLTVHVPRQQYTTAMAGIPTIRVFEALACGIPLLSAPWQDTEHLFSPEDFRMVSSQNEMMNAIDSLLSHPEEAAEQAARGLRTVQARHTCMHRAQELTEICEELFR